ncbi:MAG: hypothetical protein V1866_02055 [archaeon]
MTVIVGLASNHKEPGIVIGADKVSTGGLGVGIASAFRYIAEDGDWAIPSLIDLLKKNKFDKAKLSSSRKISISKRNQCAVAYTGTINKAHDKIHQLFLNPVSFLKDEDFLKEMLLPFQTSENLSRDVVHEYISSFDMQKRLREGYLPEVRRIFDMFVVQRHEINHPNLRITYYDRNYNSHIGELLVGKVLECEGKMTPLLLDVALTGMVYRVKYHANGYGRREAFESLRKSLGTRENFFGEETEIKKKITLSDAVEIVIQAIEYSNEKNPICQGLDYVIVTPDGIEPHFSRRINPVKMDIGTLIDERLVSIKKEAEVLRHAKQIYDGKVSRK